MWANGVAHDRLTRQTPTPAATSLAMTATMIETLARCGGPGLDVAGCHPGPFHREVASVATAEIQFVEAAPPLCMARRCSRVGVFCSSVCLEFSSKSMVVR